MSKVSVIIPCYNQSDYIIRTLKSLQNQLHKDWECIVVNDGSTDDTYEIVQEFAKIEPRVRIISKINGGTSSARNMGLKNIKGEYIQFLDADDLLDKEKFSMQLNHMKTMMLDVSYTEFCRFVETDKTMQVFRELNWTTRILFTFRFSLLVRWGIDFSIPQHCFFYSSEFFKRNKLFYDENICFREDWDFHLLISSYKPKMERLDGYIGAYYRCNLMGKVGSSIKVTGGNLNFLKYKYCELSFFEKILWMLRLSEEIWQLILRAIKNSEYKQIGLLSLLCKTKKDVFLLFSSIVLLPISFVVIIIRFIRIYIIKK